MSKDQNNELEEQRVKIAALNAALSEKTSELQELRKLIGEVSARLAAVEHAEK